VTGRRILDAGCGSGPLFAALRDRGAIVTGIDTSTGMLELARRRLGDDQRSSACAGRRPADQRAWCIIEITRAMLTGTASAVAMFIPAMCLVVEIPSK